MTVAYEVVQGALRDVLSCWSAMAHSDMDEADEDAERFEQAFYRWVESMAAWLRGLPSWPLAAEQVQALPEIVEIRECLPSPLQLNFDTEIEDICDDRAKREDDA